MGTTLSAIVESTGTIVTAGLSWSGDILDFIVDNPVICVPILFSFAGFGVGLLRRIFNY